MGNTYFLVIDIGQKLSGVEMSAVQRITTFSKHGISPVITTFAYNPDAKRNLEALKAAGRFSGEASLLNLFDYYQQVDELEIGGAINFGEVLEQSRSHQVEGTHDLYLYNDEGDVIGFCKKSNDGNHVEFVNHIINGRLYRRETFDRRGFLSRVDTINILDGFEIVFENYLRPDGTVAISKICRIENGVSTPEIVSLCDSTGALTNQFSSDQELLGHWLQEIVDLGDQDTFIVDRVLEYLPALTKAVQHSESNSRVISIVHSLHTAGEPFTTINNNFYEPMLRTLASQDGVVVHTAWQAKELQQRYGQANVEVIPHALDPIQLGDLVPITERKFDVVYVARYSAEKNHKAALAIFKEVHSLVPSAVLHFFGFGSEKESIQAQIAELGLSEVVKVHDFEADVASVYRNAKMSVLTSDVEGFALCVLESLAYGCPVISFDIRYGPSSMIEDSTNGYLVESGALKDFAGKITRLLVDPSLNQQMAVSAIQLANRFSTNEIASRWKLFLENLK